jgi:hypothetical protein
VLKKILFTLLLFLIVSSSIAQIGSAKARIILNFKEQQSLVVTHSSVDLNLNRGEVYTQGAETGVLKNHVIVKSSTPYELSVRTINPYFQYEMSLSSLPVSIIHIKPSINTSTLLDFPLRLSTINLSDKPQIILQSENRSNSQQIDVNYTIPKQNITSILNKKAGTYKTEIIYTLLPH